MNARCPILSVTGPAASARVHSSAERDVTSAAVTPDENAAWAPAGSATSATSAASAARLTVIRLRRRVRAGRRWRGALAVDRAPEHPVQRPLRDLVDRPEVELRCRTCA